MTARVLVTGVNGFVGGHLLRELVEHGFEVVGVGLGEPSDDVARASSTTTSTTTSPQSWPTVTGVDATWCTSPALRRSARRSTHRSEYLDDQRRDGGQPGRAAAARRVVARARSSSAAGRSTTPTQPLPIAEDGALRLGSPYAVSKVLVENLADYYVGRGLDWVVARPFNHIGPGQGQGFLLPDLYAGCRTAEAGDGVLEVGDLTTRRDYSDVRDVVRAYRLLLEADTAAAGCTTSARVATHRGGDPRGIAPPGRGTRRRGAGRSLAAASHRRAARHRRSLTADGETGGRPESRSRPASRTL